MIRNVLIHFSLVATFVVTVSGVANASSGLTYHGRIMLPNGRPLEASNINFDIQIRSPGAENCLLYEESQNLDMTGSAGIFVITIGDGSRVLPAVDGGNSFNKIFENRGTLTLPSCNVGSTYTPNTADGRRLAVQFNDGSGWQALPVQNMNFIPLAIEAVQVSGYSKDQLLRVADGVTATEFSSTNWNALWDLITGVSTVYSKADGSNFNPTANVNFNGKQITNLANPTSASMAATKGYVDSNFLGLGGGTLTGNVNVGANTLTNVGHIQIAAQGTLFLGKFTNAQENALKVGPPALGVGDTGRTLYNTDLGRMRYWDGSNFQSVASESYVATEIGIATASMVSQVNGTAGEIASTGGTTPTLSLATTGVSASSYGSSITVPQFTVDSKGRITTAANVPISVVGALGYTPVNRAGDTMTGFLVLNADPSIASGAATKQYVDSVSTAASGAYIRKDGTTPLTADWDIDGASSGTIHLTGLADPVALDGAATKNYVDTHIAAASYTLPTTGVSANSYGSATQVGQFTVDAQGRLTNASNIAIALPLSQITAGAANNGDYVKFNGTNWVSASFGAAVVSAEADPTVLAFAKNAPSSNFTTTGNTLELSNSGVVAGTYGALNKIPVLTVDQYGRITSASYTSLPNYYSDGSTILASFGSAGSPGLSFLGDSDTGIFEASANFLGFSTGGSQRMVIDSFGNVGVGVASPTAKLDVNGQVKGTSLNITGSIFVQNTADIRGWSGTPYAPTGSGNSPSGMALSTTNDIIGTGGNYSGLQFNTRNQVATYQSAWIGAAANTSGVVPELVFGSQIAANSYSERMRISANGNVGIGVTNPNSILTVAGVTALQETTAPTASASYGKIYVKSADGKLYFMDHSGVETQLGTGGSYTAGSTIAASFGSASSPGLTFNGDSSTGFYENGAGVIGISGGGTNLWNISSSGIASPTTGGALIANSIGTASYPTFSFVGDTGTGWFRPAASTLAASTGGQERVRIDSSGNVGIGATNPKARLDFGNTWGNIINLWGPSSGSYHGIGINNNEVQFYMPTSAIHHWSFNRGGDLQATGTNEVMRIMTSGNVGIGTTNPVATLDVAGSLLAEGTTGATPASGAGTRFEWIPAKAALRAGDVSGAQWDDSNIGNHSVAIGEDSTATASYAFAFGYQNGASGISSTALGSSNSATYSYTTALGTANTATNWGSTAIGVYGVATGQKAISLSSQYAIANAYSETAMGSRTQSLGGEDQANWVATDPLLLLGNSDSASYTSNALAILKNGKTIINSGSYSNSSSPSISTVMNGAMLTSVGATADSSGAGLNVTNSLGASKFFVRNDGNVGVGTTTPQAPLHVNGEAQVGNTGLTCTPNTKGAIRYNNVGNYLEYCNGTGWNIVQAAACSNAIPTVFSFNNLANQSTSTVVTSNIVQISGINCNVATSISGQGSPTYQICADAACGTIVQSWTNGASSLMNGQYVQLKLTTAAGGGVSNKATMIIGGGAAVWSATTAGDCSGLPSTPPAIGTVCADGTVYAGTSPDTSAPMFTTRCDYGQTWNGSACTGSRIHMQYASSNASTDTAQTNTSTGKANTAALASFTSPAYAEAPYVVPKICDSMSTAGITQGSGNWYLPSLNELTVIFNNAPAIGNFLDEGYPDFYWTSTQGTTGAFWVVGGPWSGAGWGTGANTQNYANVGWTTTPNWVRCIRR